jgi:nitrate/nitrite transporter NarK
MATAAPLTESTLLLECSMVQVAPCWQVCRPTCPSHRFFLLALICLIPFGGHFVKNEMSSIEPLLLNDPTFPISNTLYGAFNSAVSIPNFLIPILGGHLLDRQGHLSILGFLVLMCLGQALFSYAMGVHSTWLAMAGRLIFGIGEGSVVSRMDRCASWYILINVT